MKGQQRHLPSWKLRPDAPGSHEGLRYIASAKPAFRHQDGRPNIEAIAGAAGVDWRNLYRLRKDPSSPPSEYTVGALVALAASVRGVTPLTAQGRIFWFDDPRDAAATADRDLEASAA